MVATDRSNNTVDGGTAYHRAKFANVPALRSALQTAVQVELSTIPAYYTALLSMKDTSSDAYRLTRSVLMEEMFHVYQACGLLIGIGGKPQLTGQYVPTYPGYLPGFEHSAMPYLSLRRASTEVFSDVFMEIEKPSIAGTPPEGCGFETIGQFYSAVAQGMKDYETVSFKVLIKEWVIAAIGAYEHIDICLVEEEIPSPDGTEIIRISITENVEILPDKEARHASHQAILGLVQDDTVSIQKHGQTIDVVEFEENIKSIYSANEIEESVSIILDIEVDKAPLFQQAEGMEQWQDYYFGKFGGKFLKVSDLTSAQAAVNEIVQQGEGALHPSETHSIAPLEKYGAYNHYGQRVDGTFGPIVGSTLELSHYYSFQKIAQGTVPFPKTYPITSDPSIEQYQNPVANKLAVAFNIFYSTLLRSLEQSFHAGEKNHELFFKVAITIMHSIVPVLGTSVMQQPTRSNGNPAVGPNAAPTFEYVPELFCEGVKLIQSVADEQPMGSTLKSALEGIIPSARNIEELCAQENI